MNPDLLPCPGIIQNPEKNYLRRFQHLAPIAGKRCLCVGYSEMELQELVLPYQPAEIVLLTNWAGHRDAQAEKYRLVVGDITQKTVFDDNEFDFVVMLSVMEHVSDLEGALLEIRRILKPKGCLYAHFGAAWSSAYGHHLFAKPGDPLLDFTCWQMPSHIHLLCRRDEIRDFYLRKGYTVDQCQEVFHWFYETPIINRLMYEDYIMLFHTHYYLAASEVMYNYIDKDIVRLLRHQYRGYLDFSSYGGAYLLINL